MRIGNCVNTLTQLLNLMITPTLTSSNSALLCQLDGQQNRQLKCMICDKQASKYDNIDLFIYYRVSVLIINDNLILFQDTSINK